MPPPPPGSEQEPEIVRRRVSIDFEPSVSQRWDRTLCALSFLLPQGEAYFINSVHHYMDRITDPVLKEQAQRFIHQETMHAREHARANRVLTKVDSHWLAMEKAGAVALRFSRSLPRATQLATTCSLEHFTAVLAAALLANPQAIKDAYDPPFAKLWLWHAAEEIEHKAVCFDVYQHVFGKGVISYLHRVIVMAATSVIAIVATGAGFSLLAANSKSRSRDRTGIARAASPNDEAPRLAHLRRGFSLQMYLDYYRPSFHPWMHQNVSLAEGWKTLYPELQKPQTEPKPVGLKRRGA